MDQPNPFIEGNAKWRDVFNQIGLRQHRRQPRRPSTRNNGDFVGTAFFYNKKIFADAGVTAPPKTWDELLTALRDAEVARA